MNKKNKDDLITEIYKLARRHVDRVNEKTPPSDKFIADFQKCKEACAMIQEELGMPKSQVHTRATTTMFSRSEFKSLDRLDRIRNHRTPIVIIIRTVMNPVCTYVVVWLEHIVSFYSCF